MWLIDNIFCTYQIINMAKCNKLYFIKKNKIKAKFIMNIITKAHVSTSHDQF